MRVLSGVSNLVFAAAICLLSASQAFSIEPRPGWRVVPTGFAYGDLVDRLKASIQAEGMFLVAQASASDGARMNGFTIPGNRILGVYRNDYARRMLEASVAAGIEAPIRFYVTENPDQTATLSWKTPSHVFDPYMAEGGAKLEDLAAELDTVFEEIARKAVAPDQ